MDVGNLISGSSMSERDPLIFADGGRDLFDGFPGSTVS